MELDDLKKTWNQATGPVEGAHNPAPALFETMSSQKYRSKLNKITVPERVGSLVCLAAAIFIGLSFDQLNTPLLQGAGALALVLLGALPIFSYFSTWRLTETGRVTKPHAASLKSFAVQKLTFIKLQKLNMALSYLLLVTIILLLPKLFSGTDLSPNKYFWIFSFTIGYIFLMFYSKWVEKRYRHILTEAEELLLDLEGK